MWALFIMHYFGMGIIIHNAHISQIGLQNASMNIHFLNVIHKMEQILQ